MKSGMALKKLEFTPESGNVGKPKRIDESEHDEKKGGNMKERMREGDSRVGRKQLEYDII